MKKIQLKFLFTALIMAAGLNFAGCETETGNSGSSGVDSLTTLYSESFDSDADGWYFDPEIYTAALVGPGWSSSANCLGISGGNNTLTDVIWTDVGSDIQPTQISFYVISGDATLDDAIFSVVDSTEHFVFLCWFDMNGNITVQNDSGTQTAAVYTAETWYKIEYRNIDWNSHTYDFYVNGTLCLSTVKFWQNYDNIRFIQFGNFHNSTAALDEIVMVQ